MTPPPPMFSRMFCGSIAVTFGVLSVTNTVAQLAFVNEFNHDLMRQARAQFPTNHNIAARRHIGDLSCSY